jgi:hypothetical protein
VGFLPFAADILACGDQDWDKNCQGLIGLSVPDSVDNGLQSFDQGVVIQRF